ncbi:MULTISPECIES: Crp/Fnr family transcriptional regulator [Hymenobacter]|uniref:Crp/Fnr family transcriptional regulator n=1 Tax=Hymenobacter sublimis TaxID=2933777 RepID=A0ABY4JEX9_9BACT|nr:Crp/Fnr family transcriptional regulator [Hymenobacter sublimis]UPL51385.1 Crp/Fnr family transcriptional regulator [Hymenobacter sublimis]
MTVSPPPHDHSPPYELLRAHLQVRVPLTDADFTTFWGYLRPLALRKRQHLFQSGEVCNYYAFVTQGCLRSYSLTAEGHEHTLQFAPEDWWISDLYSLLTQQPSTMSIDALEDSQLLLLDQADLETIYAQCPVFERYFRLLMQSRYVVLQERVNAALSQTAAEKYQHFLRKYPTIVQRVPQHVIASYLGLTPESLSRVRRQL